MNLPKLSSIPHLHELRQEVDRLFENYVGSTPGDLLRGKHFPAINAWEDGESLIVQAEIPGVAMDHIEVYARGSELTLKGTRPSPCVQNARVFRQEHQTGDFERTIAIPIEMDPDHIEATLKEGLLTIRIPKPPLSQARKVPVRGQDASGQT
jgi:HSP20 family protein